MRQKTSMALDQESLAIAREHARAAQIDMSAWIERAIRSYAADGDVELYEQWRAALPEEEVATAAALDRAAHADLEAELSRGHIAA